MKIHCIERVIIAVGDLPAARQRWIRAGFAVSSEDIHIGNLRFARIAAGAIEIDLCAPDENLKPSPLADAVVARVPTGGGIVGWTWGVEPDDNPTRTIDFELPGPANLTVGASAAPKQLPGTLTASVVALSNREERRARLHHSLGDNPNSVDYLEHIVVMTPALQEAIDLHESIGVPCKRIREVGNGTRQAFFKLEQTVIEVVGPARDRPGCWGLAFMCRDIRAAVAAAREAGLQATEPKAAIQGGLIARIVEPLDGVAIAFMEASAS